MLLYSANLPVGRLIVGRLIVGRLIVGRLIVRRLADRSSIEFINGAAIYLCFPGSVGSPTSLTLAVGSYFRGALIRWAW